MSKERLAWLDNARFVAILVMIVGHLCGYLLKSDIFGSVLYQKFIVSFNMPLFVILSGYGNYGGLTRLANVAGFFKIIWKSFTHILFPMAFPILLYCIIERGWNPFGFEKSHWFLWMLFYMMAISAIAFGCIRVVASFVRKYLHFDNATFWLYVSIIAMMGMATLFDRQYTCEMSSYFAVGLLARHYKAFDGGLKQWWCIVIIAALSIGSYIYWFDVQSNHWFYWHGIRQMKAAGLLHHYALRQLIGIGVSFAIILATIRLSKKRTLVSELGTHTLTMYIVQDIFKRYDNVFQFDSWGWYLGWIQILTMTGFFIALSMAICILIDFIKQKVIYVRCY